MATKTHILTDAGEYTRLYLERQAQGHNLKRYPDPPYYLGFIDLDTDERWVIQINDYKASGDLDRAKEVTKEFEAEAKSDSTDD
tara:strand:- start:175 stop:426 length:252 start_codon:yes stop_codon:yes gene_type:complete